MLGEELSDSNSDGIPVGLADVVLKNDGTAEEEGTQVGVIE